MIIKNKLTDETIIEASTLAEAVLNWQDFRFADLSYQDFSGLDLYGLDFRGADLINCDLEDTDLRTVIFEYTNLTGSTLSGSNLFGVNFSGSVLSKVNMSGAILSFADFFFCDLRSVNFTGARISWNSHDIIAEILRRESNNDHEKLKVAGYILVNRDKCWTEYGANYNSYFLLDDRVLMDWAIKTLKNYITVEDDSVPDLVTNWTS